MAVVNILKNNAIGGQLDKDMKGRFDLPIVANGYEIMDNFFVNNKGNIIYSPGWQYIDGIGSAALYTFNFNISQCYLLVFRITGLIEFWTYNASGKLVKVLNQNGQAYTLAHPFGSDVFNFSLTQNSDVLYICSKSNTFPSYTMTRTASNVFTLELRNYNGGTIVTDGDNPACVEFYEGRQYISNALNKPTNLYASKAGDYNNFTEGTGVSDGFKVDLAEAKSDIYWLKSGPNALFAGSPEGVMTLGSGGNSGVTVANFTANLSSREPASGAEPILKGNFLFYVSLDRRKILVMQYDMLTNNFEVVNLNKANYGLTKDRIKKLVYKHDKHDLIYALTEQGNLIQIQFDLNENINSWSFCHRSGKIIDLSTLLRPDGGHDLFAVTQRNINKKQMFYLEKLADIVEWVNEEDFITYVDDEEQLYLQNIESIKFNDKSEYLRTIAEQQRDCCYLDAAVQYSGSSANLSSIPETVPVNARQIFWKRAGNPVTNQDYDSIEFPYELLDYDWIGRRIWIKTLDGTQYGMFDIISNAFLNENSANLSFKVYTREISIPDNVYNMQISNWYLSASKFVGLDHLEGENVVVVGDGVEIGELVVQNGQIDISEFNVSKVGTAWIGLRYNGLLKTFPINIKAQNTINSSLPKSAFRASIMLQNSSYFYIGDNPYNMAKINYDAGMQLANISQSLYNDVVRKEFASTPSIDKSFWLMHKNAMPLQILSIQIGSNQAGGV